MEKEIDCYQEKMGYHTRSEGAIQLMRKGLMYDQNIEALNKRIKELESKQNQIHLPCSVCGKPITISKSHDNPIYKHMKARYKTWAHGSCINLKGDKK
ncbi:MAG: hypothetical protein QXU98_06980 [Candidatus Parvarchaeota archaeon]